MTYTEIDRSKLCQTVVTLNDRPARITGSMHDFATVRDVETGLSAEWAWPTVALVVSRGGAFRS